MSLAVAAGCPVCSSEDHQALMGGLLRRCRRCHLAWTYQGDGASPNHDRSERKTDPGCDYGADYFDGGGYDDGYFVPSARSFEAGRRVRWLLGHRRHGEHITSLIEAGCAGGFFLRAAAAAGVVNPRGVDVSPVAIAYARSIGQRVVLGELADLPVDPVDAVCAFHLLEHLEAPLDFLQTARRLLRPGGMLALEVPNFGCPAARSQQMSWPGLQPRYHRWHFDLWSATALLGRAGFDVVAADTTVFRYYMPRSYRWRRPHRLLAADVRALRSVRLTHPTRGDLLRLIARPTNQSAAR